MTSVQASCALQIPSLDRQLHMQVHSDVDLHISRSIREQGIWEPYETALICATLNPGDCFLDVGANIGYFTVLAAACVGERGRVFAFEPEPRNFALLQANLALNQLAGQVTAVQAALSNSDGSAQLHLHPENLGDHQLYASGARRTAISVATFSGANFFAGQAALPDLVKIDTQGTEQAVVEGLLPVLQKRGAGLRMLVELTPYSLRQAGTSGARFIKLLGSLKLPFAIVDHLQHALVPVGEEELLRWCDNVDSCAEDEGFMNIFLGAPV